MLIIALIEVVLTGVAVQPLEELSVVVLVDTNSRSLDVDYASSLLHNQSLDLRSKIQDSFVLFLT